MPDKERISMDIAAALYNYKIYTISDNSFNKSMSHETDKNIYV